MIGTSGSPPIFAGLSGHLPENVMAAVDCPRINPDLEDLGTASGQCSFELPPTRNSAPGMDRRLRGPEPAHEEFHGVTSGTTSPRHMAEDLAVHDSRSRRTR